MKKIVALALTAVLALAMFACGNAAETTAAETTAAAETTVAVETTVATTAVVAE